jgi:hypothetical protein
VTAGFALLVPATLALVAASASVLVGALLRAGRRWLERREPAARVLRARATPIDDRIQGGTR